MTFEEMWKRLQSLEEDVESLKNENERINQELAEREFGLSRNKPKPKYSRDMKVQEYVKVYYDGIVKKYPGQLKLDLEGVIQACFDSAKFMHCYKGFVNGNEDRPTIYLDKKTGLVNIGTVEEYKRSRG